MTVYDLVLKLLRERKYLRGSDRKLIWAVWIELGLADSSIMREDFMQAPSCETVTRARRKVQENHPELQASIQVQSERIEKESEKGTFVYREKVKPKSNKAPTLFD